MPDIAMCDGEACPRKLECYRHRAVPTPRSQVYMTTPVRPDGSCAYFAELRNGDVISSKGPVLQEGRP